MTDLKVGSRVRLIKSTLTEAQIKSLEEDNLYPPKVGCIGTVFKTRVVLHNTNTAVEVSFDHDEHRHGIWVIPFECLEIISEDSNNG